MRSRRVVREAMRVLNINDGDMILFDREKTGFKMDDIHRIGQYLTKQGKGDCILVLVNRTEGVEVLDERQMRDLGWQRIESEANESPVPAPSE